MRREQVYEMKFKTQRSIKLATLFFALVFAIACCVHLLLLNRVHTFVLTPKQCGSLFWIGPDEYVDSDGGAYPYSEVVSEALDKDGNLVLKMTKKQVALWKEYFLNDLDKRLLSAENTSGFEVILDDNYRNITIKTDKDEWGLFSPVVSYTFIMNACGIIVLMDEGTLNNWLCETTIIFRNDVVLWHGFWPEELPEYDMEDFET
ncbi:MAG: hypothetical protein LBO63_03315 [Oscillospiraceae bacterium]|jgi:hypothetical protein|nr:hypothetical protein [Oscillospiraceae bacterium]